MIVRSYEQDGPAASRECVLHLSTQDAVDVLALEELSRKAPPEVKTNLAVERYDDCASANLYWIWRKVPK